jgi:hypothetical protein
VFKGNKAILMVDGAVAVAGLVESVLVALAVVVFLGLLSLVGLVGLVGLVIEVTISRKVKIRINNKNKQ